MAVEALSFVPTEGVYSLWVLGSTGMALDDRPSFLLGSLLRKNKNLRDYQFSSKRVLRMWYARGHPTVGVAVLGSRTELGRHGIFRVLEDLALLASPRRMRPVNKLVLQRNARFRTPTWTLSVLLTFLAIVVVEQQNTALFASSRNNCSRKQKLVRLSLGARGRAVETDQRVKE